MSEACANSQTRWPCAYYDRVVSNDSTGCGACRRLSVACHIPRIYSKASYCKRIGRACVHSRKRLSRSDSR